MVEANSQDGFYVFVANIQTKGVPDSKVHGPTWGPSRADRSQVDTMLAPLTLLSGVLYVIAAQDGQVFYWRVKRLWNSYRCIKSSQANSFDNVESSAGILFTERKDVLCFDLIGIRDGEVDVYVVSINLRFGRIAAVFQLTLRFNFTYA